MTEINTSKYKVNFYPVGDGTKSGDAILINLFAKNDNPINILIDGGYRQTGERICADLKSAYTNPKIDIMINTHPDKDHISGLKAILEDDEVRVGEIWMNRPWKDSGFSTDFFKDKRITPNSLAERLRDAFSLADDIEMIAKMRHIRIFPVFQGDVVDFITILGPSRELYTQSLLASDKTPLTIFEEYNVPFVPSQTTEEDYNVYNGAIQWIDDEETSKVNQTSIILSLKLGSQQFLFTGDAGKEAITDALDFYESLNYTNKATDFTVVQLPHHGSRKNVDPNILARWNPKSYIISCSPDGQKEGHPSRRLINKILEMNSSARIFVTKKHKFLYYEGIVVKATAQQPQKVYKTMDGISLKR